MATRSAGDEGHAQRRARIAVRAALLALCACCACSGAARDQQPAANPARGAQPEIELATADADVWAFRTEVHGSSRARAALRACVIEVGARGFPARIARGSFAAQVELEPGVNAVRAQCTTRDGRTLRSQVVRYTERLRTRDDTSDPWLLAGRPAAHGQSATAEAARVAHARADWLAHAVVYGVLPPLYGGTIADVRAALDSLRELGVDALWLAPIFASPDDDFGYAVTDYFAVRRQYGSAADLDALVRDAHQRGLRVLLDLPANHSSDQHPYFVQSERLGARSRYFAFYERDARGAATHYFDWVHLPNLDYDNPEVARFMFEAAAYWVREHGVDGYRLDAVWGIRQRNPELLPRMAAALRRVRPDTLLIAEASARDDYYSAPEHGFDAAYDWTEQLGHHAWEHVFDSERGIAARLHAAVSDTHAHAGTRVLRFLNNNDTGTRFITRHGEALTRVATAALLTLPGIPCLYAFDEIGAELEPYGELHAIHGGNQDLREFHRRWIAVRKSHDALALGDYVPLVRGEQDDVLAFARSTAEQTVIVALNFAATPSTAELELPPALGQASALRDALSGQSLPLRGRRARLRLNGWDARVFELTR